MSLFQTGNFVLASGKVSRFKIECDTLTDEDWETLALMLSSKLPPFGQVHGVPTGGLKLASVLKKLTHPTSPQILVVDDVWTTGGSMWNFIEESGFNTDYVIGAVAFSRGLTPWWVTSVCEMTV